MSSEYTLSKIKDFLGYKSCCLLMYNYNDNCIIFVLEWEKMRDIMFLFLYAQCHFLEYLVLYISLSLDIDLWSGSVWNLAPDNLECASLRGEMSKLSGRH